MRILLSALALTLATAGTASADTVPARHARSIDLGPVKGVAYYTAEADGYHVVATLAGGDAATPVRFIATLADGQKLTISTPGAEREPGAAVDIVRRGDALSIAPVSRPAD